MGLSVFRIGKKFVRGERKGKVHTEMIKLKKPEDIHGYLWDLTELFDNNKCNYIIEWYSLQR